MGRDRRKERGYGIEKEQKVKMRRIVQNVEHEKEKKKKDQSMKDEKSR